MAFPLFSILYFWMSCVLFFFGFRLYQSNKRDPNRFTEYFRNVGFLAGIGALIYTLMGIFFSHNSFALGVGNIVGEPFYLASFVYMVAAFFYMTFPQVSQKKVITAGLIFVVLTFISHLYFFPYPIIDARGILHFNAPTIPGLTFTIFSALSYFPLLIAFTREAIREKHLRKRSGAMAAAIALFFVSGVMQSLIDQPLIYTSSFFIQAFASALLFLGVLARVKRVETE